MRVADADIALVGRRIDELQMFDPSGSRVRQGLRGALPRPATSGADIATVYAVIDNDP